MVCVLILTIRTCRRLKDNLNAYLVTVSMQLMPSSTDDGKAKELSRQELEANYGVMSDLEWEELDLDGVSALTLGTSFEFAL